MGRPLFFEIIEKPVTSIVITLCSGLWLYIQQKHIGYAEVGMSYENVVIQGQYWRILSSTLSHISFLHLAFNMSALWSLGIIEDLGSIGLGVTFYVQYTLILILVSAAIVLGMYHLLIHRFKLDYYKRVTAVGYSCVTFGWMTILASKRASSKLELFGLLSLPINFAPFESLIFTSIIVPQASFLGHLAGIIAGYLVGWGIIQGTNTFWFVSLLVWTLLVCGLSVHRTTSHQFPFLVIEAATNGDTSGNDVPETTVPLIGSELV